MQRKLRVIAVGGTFDELHNGHKGVLMKAFEMGEHVVIGVSSDEFVKSMNKPHATASYEERTRELRSYLKDSGLLERAEIIPTNDAYGGLILAKNPIEGLVVSRETEPTAIKINQKRGEIGLPLLEIVVVDMVPSENHIAISTTRIKEGEIDHEGRLLKRK
jgi:pantetheine-phosphate adenylyltransferase